MAKSAWTMPLSNNKGGHTEKKSLVLGLNDELSRFVRFGMEDGAGTPAAAMALYDKSSVVSIPVTYIGDAFASINPVLKKGEEIIRSHPLLDLLNMPSDQFTKMQLMQALGKNYLIAGETEVLAIGNVNRPPLAIFPMNPSLVSPVEGSSGIIQSHIVSDIFAPGSYVLQSGRNAGRYFNGNLKEIVQIRNYSTRNNSMFRGQSPLLAASAEVRHHIKGNEHNVSLLDNGGRISVVFHFSDDLSYDDFIETKRRVLEQFSGPQKAGMPVITSGEKLNIQEMSTNNRDMDYANLQAKSKEAVAQVYKFPLPLLTVDASTLDNYKTAKEALYDDAALPLADCIYMGLQSFLFPRFGLDPSVFRLTYDLDDIPALSARRSKRISDRVKDNTETINELRQLRGLKPVKGGNVIRMPVNMVPIGENTFNDDMEG